MFANVYVYEMLRVCVRGFSEGKSEASKRATNFGLGKTSNFLYTVLPNGFYNPT
jgi:ABC-type arginine transport system permease subunit